MTWRGAVLLLGHEVLGEVAARGRVQPHEVWLAHPSRASTLVEVRRQRRDDADAEHGADPFPIEPAAVRARHGNRHHVGPVLPPLRLSDHGDGERRLHLDREHTLALRRDDVARLGVAERHLFVDRPAVLSQPEHNGRGNLDLGALQRVTLRASRSNRMRSRTLHPSA